MQVKDLYIVVYTLKVINFNSVTPLSSSMEAHNVIILRHKILSGSFSFFFFSNEKSMYVSFVCLCACECRLKRVLWLYKYDVKNILIKPVHKLF